MTSSAAVPSSIDAYAPAGSFSLPGAGRYDVLPDGRVVAVADTTVYVETGVGTRSFATLGTLSGASFPGGAYGGPAFVRVSPDGTRLAVGNNGGAAYDNYQVGVFNLSDLSGAWYAAGHYEAEWRDNRYLGLTAGDAAGTRVTALDTQSADPLNPTNPTLVTNIGGASTGLTFSSTGYLFTGNGYAFGGPSGTGAIKAFAPSAWEPALTGGAAVDFENSGTLVGDLLSAGSLGFDVAGNLFVGGGDLFGSGDGDYAALVSAAALQHALAGLGAVNPADPTQVRRLDPDAAYPFNYYDVNYNAVSGELYLREGATVYAYAVPEPASLVLMAVLLMAAGRRLRAEGT
jgi:hypothetical protein